MKKKVMAVVLAGIMVLTAACGSKSPSEDSASQAVSEEEASQADTQEETDTEEVIESEKTVLEDGVRPIISGLSCRTIMAPTPEWRKASPKRSIPFCREMSQ